MRSRAALVLQRSFRGHKARRTVRGWARVVDPVDGDIYWFNVASGISSWFPPGVGEEEGEEGNAEGDSVDITAAAVGSGTVVAETAASSSAVADSAAAAAVAQ